jgi:hypothetical protein
MGHISGTARTRKNQLVDFGTAEQVNKYRVDIHATVAAPSWYVSMLSHREPNEQPTLESMQVISLSDWMNLCNTSRSRMQQETDPID